MDKENDPEDVVAKWEAIQDCATERGMDTYDMSVLMALGDAYFEGSTQPVDDIVDTAQVALLDS